MGMVQGWRKFSRITEMISFRRWKKKKPGYRCICGKIRLGSANSLPSVKEGKEEIMIPETLGHKNGKWLDVGEDGRSSFPVLLIFIAM